jgi:cytochrome c biogenesis protein ResB
MNKVQYLLCCLSEELSEVQQEVGKCLRFTPDHRYSEYPNTNIEKVRLEMADVYAISIMLFDEGIDTGIEVPYQMMNSDMRLRFEEKKFRTLKLMDTSRELGVLHD